MYYFTDELGRIFLEWYSCAMVHWWSDDEPGVAAYQFGVAAFQFDVDAYQFHAGDDTNTDTDYNSMFEGHILQQQWFRFVCLFQAPEPIVFLLDTTFSLQDVLRQAAYAIAPFVQPD